MSRLFELVTYVVSNASTPEFWTEDSQPVEPTDPIVQSMDGEDTILSVSGNIRKGDAAKDFATHTLKVSAEKYRHEAFDIEFLSGNVIRLTLPEFKKGRAEKVRAVDPKAAATVTLSGFFAQKRKAKAEAEAAAAKAEAKAKADAEKAAAKAEPATGSAS